MSLETLKVSNSELLKYAVSTAHFSKCYCLGIFNHILLSSVLKVIKNNCNPKHGPQHLKGDLHLYLLQSIFRASYAQHAFGLNWNVMVPYANMVTLCWKQHNGKMNLLNSCLITAQFRLWLGGIAILILLHYRWALIIYLCNWMCSLNQSWENG